ncbi:MAG: ParB/RepB/Spo0J family partition protein [Patescibacteria group bacterium]
MKRPSGLGRGLGALIPPAQGGSYSSSGNINDRVAPQADGDRRSEIGDRNQDPSNYQLPTTHFLEIPVDQIKANPHQPRVHFDHAALEDLVSSIQERGVVQPLIVTKLADGEYELVAGERRLRASKIAGLQTVPCIIRTANDQEKLELAIIENVQRHDLNPIEEAAAYKRLMDEFGMTQDEVGIKVGKSRPLVANTVRLLQLPEEIKQALMERKISASHARTLLSLPTDEERMRMFRAMLDESFTVRDVERRVSHPRSSASAVDPNLLEHEHRLRDVLGHRVNIKRQKNGEGEIRIQFLSDEDLQGLVGRLGK